MKKILTILFIIFIYTPLFCLLLNIQDGLENTEKRNMKEFPRFQNIIQFTDGFLKYYEDNFGLRYSFMRFASNLKIKLFKTYPKNIEVKVLKGKNDWLFYKLGNETEDYTGKVPFNEEKLKKINKNIEIRKKFLHPKKFYILIPPDKTVIYPEFLPESIEKNKNIEKSRIYQLLKTNNSVIYPKATLMQNKNKGQLYFKRDTHWTYLGAYFGYLEVMNSISQDFKIYGLDIKNFNKKEYSNKTPDLSNITGVGTNIEEKSFIYECPSNSKKSNLKILIFGDSFLKYLEPYFLCTFKNVKFVNSNVIKKEEVEKFNPDIIILEIVQRNLRQLEIKDGF